MAYGQAVLEIINYVSSTDKTHPLTGVYSQEQDIAGWQWSRRRLENAHSDFSRYLSYVGGHEIGLLDGLALGDWQSGVVEGIEYNDMQQMPLGNSLTWTPRYSTGAFSVYWDNRTLYSDYSFSENADALVDDRTTMELRDDCVHQSITAQMFKRTDTFEIVTVVDASLVTAFTGVIDTGARVEIDEGVPVDWALVETRKHEMLVDDTTLYFNQDFSFMVGATGSAYNEGWQSMGPGLLTGRDLYLKYFPLASGSVQLVSVDSAATETTWTEVDNLNFSGPTDYHFSVNHDLGVVTTGGYQAPDLVLAAALTAVETEVQVVVSDDMDSYPDQGVIQIGTELIQYLGKTRSAFIDCVRAYDGTTAAAATLGDIVMDQQHGAGTKDNWYCAYTAVPRVEYEITDHKLRTANYSTWLDVRALTNVKANNIVQLVSQDDNLASIELTTDSPALGGNLYGPVYYGTDTSKLTATGYDSAGNPVEDIPLTIYIKDGVGSLNGSLSSYTSNSNSLGESYAFYNAPYSTDTTTMEVSKTEHDGADTHMTVDINTTVQPSEVWVFQVLKHDPVLGTVGNAATAFEAGTASEPNGLGYIDVWLAFTEDYNGGTLLLEDASGVRRSIPVRWAEQQYDSNLEPYVRFFLDESADPAWIVGTASCWLFQEEAVSWDTALMRGAKVILYEWTAGATHPITGLAGAYMPVRPDAVQGNVLVFTGRNLAIPDPDDQSNNLGAYIVIAPSEVRCSAYGRDPFSGNLITSNDIRLSLRLPNTLIGVDESGALPIPYGWTLVTEEFNIGAGLDGANFLTVNPAATGINQFSVTGVF